MQMTACVDYQWDVCRVVKGAHVEHVKFFCVMWFGVCCTFMPSVKLV